MHEGGACEVALHTHVKPRAESMKAGAWVHRMHPAHVENLRLGLVLEVRDLTDRSSARGLEGKASEKKRG